MLKAKLASLLFAVLTSISLAFFAAETHTRPEPVVETAEVTPTGKININTVDAVTLQRELLGISEVKAQATVAYRDEHGGFDSVDELLEVNGIGEATLEKSCDKLSTN